MPHAEETMSSPKVNGDKSHSQTLEHLTAYPLTSDILSIYQSNPLGQKSIALFNSAYSTFAEPLFPYLKTPYSIIAPYLEKADTYGDSALSKADERYPAIKKTDIDSLKSHAASVAQYPFKVAGEGKDYVLSTYDDEYQNGGGEGIVYKGKAVVTTEIRIASEAFNAFLSWFGPKQEEAKDEFEKMKKLGVDKLQKTKKEAKSKTDEAKDYANEKTEQGKAKAQEGKEKVEAKKNEVAN